MSEAVTTESVSSSRENDLVEQLRRKRREIAYEVRETEQLLRELRADLDALDGALAVFDPQWPIKTPRQLPHRYGARSSKTGRFRLNSGEQSDFHSGFSLASYLARFK